MAQLMLHTVFPWIKACPYSSQFESTSTSHHNWGERLIWIKVKLLLSQPLEANYLPTPLQQSSSPICSPCAQSRCFNAKLHEVSRLCHVTNALPTDNYIPIHIDPLQSTYTLPVVDWPNPFIIHLQSTFVWPWSIADGIKYSFFTEY